MHIDALICTFRRPALRETLESLARQNLPKGVTLAVIIADNDDTPSARELVTGMADDLPYDVRYVHAPARNISIARNACLDATQADWIAFLDDDESAPPGWIAALVQRARDTGADAVFGPVKALYPDDSPDWIVSLDMHSNRPVYRHGEIMTGHTCNALLRWGDAPWAALRFDLDRGVSGGEDTAFFFDARRRGMVMTDAPDAELHEAVDPKRLQFGWMFRRRFRMGQSYLSSANSALGRVSLVAQAAAKAGLCLCVGTLLLPSPRHRNGWYLRGALHAGVVAGGFSVPQLRLYGGN